MTEGELDALNVSGAGQQVACGIHQERSARAKKDIQKSLEFLEGYETVVLMFDMDEAGQQAAKICAQVLTPGKAKIASLIRCKRDAR